MDAQMSGSVEKLGVVVADVNATAVTVASLNRAIVSGTHARVNVNDLKDQRDLLVQRLASLTGATVRQGDAGSVDVVLDGRPLVAGRTATSVEVGTAAPPSTAPAVVWSGDRTPASAGGEAGGLLHGLTTAVPRYRDGLAQVATRLADVVNAQHRAGYDAAGAHPATDFFVTQPDGRLVVGITDPARVAASSTGTAGGDAGGGNALVLARTGSLAGGPDQAYRALVVTLGVEAQTANRSVDIQASILAQVDAARESDAGVNLDEEMTTMLAYQRAYEGAARFLTSVDQMLDTLINRTGLVGR
jgi:flagellar hook-associated protein 1 FlgK